MGRLPPPRQAEKAAWVRLALERGSGVERTSAPHSAKEDEAGWRGEGGGEAGWLGPSGPHARRSLRGPSLQAWRPGHGRGSAAAAEVRRRGCAGGARAAHLRSEGRSMDRRGQRVWWVPPVTARAVTGFCGGRYPVTWMGLDMLDNLYWKKKIKFFFHKINGIF